MLQWICGEGVQEYTFNIETFPGTEMNYINVESLIGYDLPAILVTSNGKVCKDLTDKFSIDNYYLVTITDSSQIDIIISGEYFIANRHCIYEWSDNYAMDYGMLEGKHGIYSDIIGISINKNSDTIYKCSVLDDDFSEARKFAEDILNTDGNSSNLNPGYFTIGEYSISISKGFFSNGKVLTYLRDDQTSLAMFNSIVWNETIYDATSGTRTN